MCVCGGGGGGGGGGLCEIESGRVEAVRVYHFYRLSCSFVHPTNRRERERETLGWGGGEREKLIGGRVQRGRDHYNFGSRMRILYIYKYKLYLPCTHRHAVAFLFILWTAFEMRRRGDQERAFGCGSVLSTTLSMLRSSSPASTVWIHREVQRFSLITAVSWREEKNVSLPPSPPPPPQHTHNRGVPGC